MGAQTCLLDAQKPMKFVLHYQLWLSNVFMYLILGYVDKNDEKIWLCGQK